MANWDEIRVKVGNAAKKTAKKTEEIAQITAKYVKLKALDAKLSGKYEELGRYTYKQIKNEVSQAEKISLVITEIDALRVQRKTLKEEIEADKKKRAEAKAAEKTENGAEPVAEETDEKDAEI